MRDSFNILLLPGDGIGPEVVGAARTVMDVAAEHFGVTLSYEERKIGGTAIREEGEPVSRRLWRGPKPRTPSCSERSAIRTSIEGRCAPRAGS
jgi:3-isopropylmalate dehydrogenase